MTLFNGPTYRVTDSCIPQTVPLVVDSPHSGSILPEDFDFICSLHDLRVSEDSYVDHFARSVPHFGGSFLQCLINRAYIDVNRPLSDLHPDLCADPIPWPVQRSKRSINGIGLIRSFIKPDQPVYQHKLSLEQIMHRINHVYHPYYQQLEQMIQRAHTQFSRVLHVNLHATPSIVFKGSAQPDIILGDHDGHSCARVYREWFKNNFEKQGLKVVINHPYKGVELTRRFAKPRQGFHSIQIEINKALYMDEASLAIHAGKGDVQALFDIVWQNLAEWLGQHLLTQAAE